MVPRRGDAVCTSRRCELRHLAAWAEGVITRRQINVSIDRVGLRRPHLQQFSPRLVAGSRQYLRVGEVELMALLQRLLIFSPPASCLRAHPVAAVRGKLPLDLQMTSSEIILFSLSASVDFNFAGDLVKLRLINKVWSKSRVGTRKKERVFKL
nr:unnamed protein product [Spirometra erinaceieuropaei]